jgi:hypothetical protein
MLLTRKTTPPHTSRRQRQQKSSGQYSTTRRRTMARKMSTPPQSMSFKPPSISPHGMQAVRLPTQTHSRPKSKSIPASSSASFSSLLSSLKLTNHQTLTRLPKFQQRASIVHHPCLQLRWGPPCSLQSALPLLELQEIVHRQGRTHKFAAAY